MSLLNSFLRQVMLMTLFTTMSFNCHSQTARLDSIISTIEFRDDSIHAVFNWVANEIEYDTQSLLLPLESNIGTFVSPEKGLINEAINRKKGVCQHYAELFKALTRRLGYESYVVTGYTKLDIINDKYGHAWNAIKTGKGWFFYDPTWSSGYVNNFLYKKKYNEMWYKVSPETFIQTHIPFDPIWQLLNPPLSNYQIKENDFVVKNPGNYNFQDSIRAESKLTEYNRHLASLQRLKTVGITNNLIRKHAENEDQFIKQRYNFGLLESASDSVTKAIFLYNNYVFAKNNSFKKPAWTDEMLKSMPVFIKSKIEFANNNIDLMVSADYNLLQSKAELKKQISSFTKLYEKESVFISKYLTIWKPLRSSYLLKLF